MAKLPVLERARMFLAAVWPLQRRVTLEESDLTKRSV